MKKQIQSIIWKYYAFSFLRSFTLFAGILVPFFTEWGGLTLLQIQLLQSWYMLWVFILEVPSGVIADKFGRKISVMLGVIIMGIAVGLYGSFSGFIFYLGVELLFALATALVSGADQALLYDSLKESGEEAESKKVIGRAHAFSLAGIGLAAPLGSLIAGIYGLNIPVLLTAIPLFLAAIVAFSIKEPRVHRKAEETTRYMDILKTGVVFFYKHKTLRVLAFDGILVASAGYFVFWLYQPLLEQSGVPVFYFGFIHTFLVGVQILIASNFQRLENIFGSAKVLLRFSALFTSIGFFLVAIWPNVFTIILFIILAGGFGLTRMELMWAYMHKYIPSEKRATVSSSISMFRRFALMPMNIAVGFIAVQSLSIALLFIAILPLLVFLFSPIEQEMLED